jgi:hypothetical protein
LGVFFSNPTFLESVEMSVDDAQEQKDGERSGAIAPSEKDLGNSRLGVAINDTIGKRLQAHYRALADEPLPDRFIVLLAQLRAKELKS